MLPSDELEQAIQHMEDIVGKLGLLVLCFRRLAKAAAAAEGKPDRPKPDFDYMTGMPPK